MQDTHTRIYVPASNIERQPDDGCMKKIKIERSLKLRKEDFRSKTYNPVTNTGCEESQWINSFGGQKEQLYEKVQPKVEIIHTEKKNIASFMTCEDK